MSPKSRRSKPRFRRIVRQPAVSAATSASNATLSTPITQPATTTAASTQYNYIINDLRLIGIIAGAMIVCIIILSFIL